MKIKTRKYIDRLILFLLLFGAMYFSFYFETEHYQTIINGYLPYFLLFIALVFELFRKKID